MESVSVEITAGDITPITVQTTTVDVPIVSADAYFCGYSFRETTGAAAATAQLKSGDRIVAEIVCASGGSDKAWTGPQGVLCNGGITLHVIAGSVEGVVYAGYCRV